MIAKVRGRANLATKNPEPIEQAGQDQAWPAVADLVRDEGAAGSNPATPTKQNQSLRSAE